ncbi:MAG: hypothetical protein AAFR77_23585 [Cyanobacteria bacterium J06631_2]
MSNRQRQQTQVRGDTWRSEMKEVIGGASGGFLFGIPLIYRFILRRFGLLALMDETHQVQVARTILRSGRTQPPILAPL